MRPGGAVLQDFILQLRHTNGSSQCVTSYSCLTADCLFRVQGLGLRVVWLLSEFCDSLNHGALGQATVQCHNGDESYLITWAQVTPLKY